MTTGTTVSILPCGAMTADLTWLLLAPGRAIRNRQNKHLPAGTMIFTADAVYMGASYGPPVVPAAIVNNLEQFYSSVEKLRGIATEANATVVFGHDPDQITELRTAPEGSYR